MEEIKAFIQRHRAFANRIRPYVDFELERAVEADFRCDSLRAFSHLERAHILGQASTRDHVRVHFRMLIWSLKYRHPKEFFGQIVRIIGAAMKTSLGWIPTGNTGGSNVSAFKSMPISADLAAILERARTGDG